MSKIQSFRKKPVVIQAMQYDGTNSSEIIAWANGSINLKSFKYVDGVIASSYDYLVVSTLEGDMIINLDDWIIKGVVGEFYSCKPDIFAKTYELVED
jgi:hypothetical protein